MFTGSYWPNFATAAPHIIGHGIYNQVATWKLGTTGDRIQVGPASIVVRLCERQRRDIQPDPSASLHTTLSPYQVVLKGWVSGGLNMRAPRQQVRVVVPSQVRFILFGLIEVGYLLT